jgi:DNA invertase Pin-like site-specific DNA recombinase
MVFGFMASLAQFESALISERVKAGMQRARQEGKHIGRPPIPTGRQQKIRKLYQAGISINQAADVLKIVNG